MAVAVGKSWTLADDGAGRGDMLAGVVGAAVQDAITPHQIALYAEVTGFVDESTVASVRYKREVDSLWSTANPLWRIKPDYTDLANAPVSVVDAFAGVIFDLEEGTTYDVEVTYDDGSTPDVRPIQQFVTRSLPRAAGAVTATPTTEGGLASAIAAASPGDVIQFSGDITVTGPISVGTASLKEGTAADPIFIRGDNIDTARLVASSTDLRMLLIRNANHFVFENFSLVGNGVNVAGSSFGGTIGFDDTSTYNQTNHCFRDLKFIDVNKGINSFDITTDCLVYNCEFTGNNSWVQAELESTDTWNDDGVRLGGIGNCVWNCTLTGFGDPLSFRRQQDNFLVAGSFMYRNKLRNSGDDAFELEYCTRNCGVYDNYSLNSMTGASIDGVFGGPLYVFRNRFINMGRQIIKNGAETSGVLFMANSFVKTEGRAAFSGQSGWYWSSSARVRGWEYRSNVFIWEGPEEMLWWEYSNLNTDRFEPVNMFRNGWALNGDQFNYNNQHGRYSTVAAANAGSAPNTEDSENTNQASTFETPVVFGANYLTEITTEYDLALSSGSDSVGTGESIPNISENIDQGAYGFGESPPAIGFSDPSTTVLGTLAASLSSGGSASFPDGSIATMTAQTSFSPNWRPGDLDWQAQFLYWASGSEVNLFGDIADDVTADTLRHARYDITTNTWSLIANFVNPDILGHVYGNNAINPDNGDVFEQMWNENFIWGCPRSTNIWGSYTSPDSNILSGIGGQAGSGLVWHPNLYGVGGLIFSNRNSGIFGWNSSTDTWTEIFDTFPGTQRVYGMGVYWEANDIAVIGGASQGGSATDLYSVNASGVRTSLGAPPIPTTGNASGIQGTLMVNPANTNELLIVERDGAGRWWTSTDGSTWDWQGSGCPVNLRTLCAIPRYGIVWGLDFSNSIIWKP